MSEVKPMIAELGEQLREFNVKDPEAGTITPSDEAATYILDKLGIDLDEHIKHQVADGNIHAAFLYAFGRDAIEMMAENPSLPSVTMGKVKIGNDTLKGTTSRESQVPAGRIAEGEKQKTKTVYGNTVIAWAKRDIRNTVVSNVRKDLQAYGLEKLST